MKDKLAYLDYINNMARNELRPLEVDNDYYVIRNKGNGAFVYNELYQKFETCFICGKKTDLTPHRIVHECVRGDYHVSNVVLICSDCHNNEFEYWSMFKNIVFSKKNDWNAVIDISFDIFKRFLLSKSDHDGNI